MEDSLVSRYWERLVAERHFVEVAYFAGVSATASPSAEAHLFAGIGCCGCVEPQAVAQRVLEDEDGLGGGGLRVSFATRLPYAGLDHLLEAVRADPELRAPDHLREVIDGVAEDLAYVSRREVRTSSAGYRHSHGLTCVAAALLLRRLTGSERELPGVMAFSLRAGREVLEAELTS
jgi:hypothetical protein